MHQVEVGTESLQITDVCFTISHVFKNTEIYAVITDQSALSNLIKFTLSNTLPES